jgi:dGTPase
LEARLTPPTNEVLATLDERRHPETPSKIRTETQRDRDRILYSSAFLRLAHVTQVAAPEVGHTFHSRMIHSLKVAQVARVLARQFKVQALRGELEPVATKLVEALDEHATEGAALAHDLGHPPFGHLAENVLQRCSKDGGASFEGNPQSFRIVTRLALRSVDIPGLNLTRRTLNGMLKYPWLHAEEPVEHAEKWGAYDGDKDYFHWARQGMEPETRTLEAHLMDWADDVSYAVHDMDDFYRAGLVPLDRLVTDPLELAAFKDDLAKRYEQDAGRLASAADRLFGEGFISSIRTRFAGRAEERVSLRSLGSLLITRYVEAVSLRDAPDGESAILHIPEDIQDEVTILKRLTWFYIIDRPSLAVIQRGHEHIIESLYKMYHDAMDSGRLDVFPPAVAEQVKKVKGTTLRERIIIDLIASMTEISATEIYRQHLGVSHGSIVARASGPL